MAYCLPLSHYLYSTRLAVLVRTLETSLIGIALAMKIFVELEARSDFFKIKMFSPRGCHRCQTTNQRSAVTVRYLYDKIVVN